MVKEVLSSSLEDYLECVYNRITLNGSVKAVEISKELNVSRASVTEALNKLANKEFINYGRYEMISMTEAGKKKAKEIANRHNIIETFLVEILNIEHSEASEFACRMEHVISENILQGLSQLNNFCKTNNDFIVNFKNK